MNIKGRSKMNSNSLEEKLLEIFAEQQHKLNTFREQIKNYNNFIEHIPGIQNDLIYTTLSFINSLSDFYAFAITSKSALNLCIFDKTVIQNIEFINMLMIKPDLTYNRFTDIHLAWNEATTATISSPNHKCSKLLENMPNSMLIVRYRYTHCMECITHHDIHFGDIMFDRNQPQFQMVVPQRVHQSLNFNECTKGLKNFDYFQDNQLTILKNFISYKSAYLDYTGHLEEQPNKFIFNQYYRDSFYNSRPPFPNILLD
tara:strand:+ start:662 stop:1432 length:771 start_codon:yes stop_codon:yes gene_type:complete